MKNIDDILMITQAIKEGKATISAMVDAENDILYVNVDCPYRRREKESIELSAGN